MKTIKDIRFSNARLLAEQVGSQKAIVEITGRQQSQISQIMGKTPTKPIGNAVARALEQAFKKPRGWMDQIHYDSMSASTSGKVYDAALDGAVGLRKEVQWISCISWDMSTNWCDSDTSNNIENCDWLPSYKTIGPRSFVLRMKSDEATILGGGKSYPEHSLLFIDPDLKPVEGDYVIAKVYHLYTPICRKFVMSAGEQKIVPINDSQQDQAQYDCKEFKVIGVVRFGIV